MKQRLRVFFIVLSVLLGALLLREYTLLPDGRLHAVFFDVGQGDGALLILPNGAQIVIDGGPDWSTLEKLSRHMPFFDREIDAVVLSHPNLDHLASLPEVMRRYDVKALFLGGSTYDLGAYEAMIARATEKRIPIVRLEAGHTMDLPDGVRMETLWPPAAMPAGMSRDINNESLVLKLTHGETSLLLTGDIEKTVEETLVAARADIDADILKVPHHGSKSSSSTGFLLAVSPEIAVISAGKDNSYGHPSPAVLKRLEAVGARVRRTDREGDIELVW